MQRKTYGAVPCQVLCAGVTGQFLSQGTQPIQEACGQGSQSRDQRSLESMRVSSALATADTAVWGIWKGLASSQVWGELALSLSSWESHSAPGSQLHKPRPHLTGTQGGEKNKDIQLGLQQYNLVEFKRPAFMPISLFPTFSTLMYSFFYQGVIVNI